MISRARASDVLVVCSHLPGEGHFDSELFRVVPRLCADLLDYWRALVSVWDSPSPIVNVEHDVAVTDEHIAALIDCPHPLCAWAYRTHWITNGVGDLIAAGTGRRDPATNPDPGYLTGGEEWAAWSAIGLCKIAPEARVGPLRPEPWMRLELAVHDAVKRPWHLHWPPVAHHHW